MFKHYSLQFIFGLSISVASHFGTAADILDETARIKTTHILNQRGIAVTEYLGRGSFGSVYKAFEVSQQKIGGRFMAIKKQTITHLDQDPDLGGIAAVVREILILQSIKHPNILKSYQTFLSCSLDTEDQSQKKDQDIYSCLELMDGNLTEVIVNNFNRTCPLSSTDQVGIIRQIINGLGSLHRLGIAHRDLKPANILVSYGERPGLTGNQRDYIIKIADFGLASCLHSPCDSLKQPTCYVASGWYRAPELAAKIVRARVRGQKRMPEEKFKVALAVEMDRAFIKLGISCKDLHRKKFFARIEPLLKDNDFYGVSLDLWGVGIMTYEILGCCHYSGTRGSAEHLVKCYLNDTPDEPVPQNKKTKLMIIADALLSLDPHYRPTCDKLLTHPDLQDSRYPSKDGEYDSDSLNLLVKASSNQQECKTILEHWLNENEESSPGFSEGIFILEPEIKIEDDYQSSDEKQLSDNDSFIQQESA